jgi:hypothetical protein
MPSSSESPSSDPTKKQEIFHSPKDPLTTRVMTIALNKREDGSPQEIRKITRTKLPMWIIMKPETGNLRWKENNSIEPCKRL